ncbi:MAG: HEAT repeat domain-containing protein, partial [Vicinamibacteria bacterium]
MLFLLLFSWPLDQKLLAVEDARDDPAALIEALETPGPHVRQAIRALGRFERQELSSSVLPFLSSTEAELRIEAANALAQMRTSAKLAPSLAGEREPRVRAALYEAMGRLGEGGEALLLPGLEERELVRLGAVKGLERFYRTNDVKPTSAAVTALRKAVRESVSSAIRQLGLLALNRAGDGDRETLESALADRDPQVRRLAVVGLKAWRDDPSFMVRYEALRASGDCARAASSLSDPSEHVELLAIDLLGNGCSPEPLESALEEPKGWRAPAHALVSLAKIDPARAREHLPAFVAHPVWQARVYGARAAKVLGDEEALAKLRSDENPNVVAEALVRPEDALAALSTDDYGLLVTALEKMKDWDGGATAVPALLEILNRLTDEKRHTSRDPRSLALERLRELGGPSIGEKLDGLVSDFDPAIAGLAAEVIAQKTGRTLQPKTTRFAPDPLP